MDSLSPLQDFLNAHSQHPTAAAATPANSSTAVTTTTMFAASAMPSIKVEEPSTTITPDLLSLSDSPSPPPESLKAESSSKQVKKRKSWGQVLPEPTTNLPPRKRAKTADEKEQRRIERVKRNRLAAHNSRERKREEMEKLQLENDALVEQMNTMQQQIQQLQDEIRQFRSGKAPSVSSFSFSAATATVPAAPATTLTTPELGNLESPITNPDDFSQPPTPAAEEQRFVEPTQQSAVSFDEACLSQSLFPSLTTATTPSSKQFGHVEHLPNFLAQPTTLPNELFDSFFNLEPDQHPTDAASSAVPPASGNAGDQFFPDTPGSLHTDLLLDDASETSDILSILADSGAPSFGSDGSGFGAESADFPQVFSFEEIGV